MSDVFIDRRLNPKGKSLGNRQRFIKKVEEASKKALRDAIKNKKIQDIGNGEKIIVPADTISQPRFTHKTNSGKSQRVLSGNKEFTEGDRILKPQSGKGGGGNEGSPDGGGNDDFTFVLNRDEFLDILFEDLELPDLVKKDLKKTYVSTPQRAGYTNTGSPSNLDVERSYKSSLGRRIALKRPSNEEIEELEKELELLYLDEEANKNQIDEIIERLEILRKRQKQVPFFDDVDMRFRLFKKQPNPTTNAVMFCILDVSASMDETKKDWAKRFFTLLYLFLQRQYKNVEIVFIRHHSEAKEVDEYDFFNSTETGGTIVSTALEVMKSIIDERYPSDSWNIYAGQASDGDNYHSDNPKTTELLNELLLKIQYYAYIQISTTPRSASMDLFGRAVNSDSNLWSVYSDVAKKFQNLQCKFITDKSGIWTVFRALFERKKK
jgi:uncharacterized sporulation protein YeaH/YhbH (DUF444 family)